MVDDDHALLRAYKNALGSRGVVVETAMEGLDAKARIAKTSFDVVISDINMPGYGGLEFLRAVRERDLDVPVILMTGKPSVDTSIRAVEYGIFRYLVKPVAPDALADVIRLATRLHRMARLKRQALEVLGVEGKWLGDRAALESRFASANESMWVAFQPIVSWSDRRIFGYEALLRSGEPTLASPIDFIEAAERLGRLHELGRAIRKNVVEAVRRAPGDVKLFVNLHASDLNDDQLLDSASHLSGIGHRVILEITERASLDEVKDVTGRVKKLRALGFRIAVDDLGSGYAGLSTFTLLEPEVAKLDMSLVRGIDAEPKNRASCGRCSSSAPSWASSSWPKESKRPASVTSWSSSAATCSRVICSPCPSAAFRARSSERRDGVPQGAGQPTRFVSMATSSIQASPGPCW